MPAPLFGTPPTSHRPRCVADRHGRVQLGPAMAVMLPDGIPQVPYDALIESTRWEVGAALSDAAGLVPAGVPLRTLSH
jgi:hypothetical protein